MPLKDRPKTIWKFPLEIVGEQTLLVPGHWQPYSAKEQNGQVCLWMGVDPQAPKIRLHIRIVGTGQPADDIETLTFVDTVMTAGGALVWHVFIDPYK